MGWYRAFVDVEVVGWSLRFDDARGKKFNKGLIVMRKTSETNQQRKIPVR